MYTYIRMYVCCTQNAAILIASQMGAWLADYLDDAGYIGWEMHASIYKAASRKPQKQNAGKP